MDKLIHYTTLTPAISLPESQSILSPKGHSVAVLVNSSDLVLPNHPSFSSRRVGTQVLSLWVLYRDIATSKCLHWQKKWFIVRTLNQLLGQSVWKTEYTLKWCPKIIHIISNSIYSLVIYLCGRFYLCSSDFITGTQAIMLLTQFKWSISHVCGYIYTNKNITHIKPDNFR